MPATFNIPTQNVIPGQLITAVLWNGEFQNLFINFTPQGVDDYAATDGQFQSQTDPFPAGAISRPTSLAGELERLRFEVAQLKGKTYHYEPSDVTLAQVVDTLIKPGFIVPYGASVIPTGWLPCDGAAISRSTYAALFAVIGTNFGSGDGTTTFNVPDCRGRAIFGKAPSGTFQTLGATGGAETHSHTQAAHRHTLSAHTHNVNHTHTINAHTHSLLGSGQTLDNNPNFPVVVGPGGILYMAGGAGSFQGTTNQTTSDGAQTTSGPTSNTSGTANPDTTDSGFDQAPAISVGLNVPPFFVLQMMIKT